MIEIYQEFQSLTEAEAFVETTINRYHPCGYGTTLSVYQMKDHSWIVKGYRYASCD